MTALSISAMNISLWSHPGPGRDDALSGKGRPSQPARGPRLLPRPEAP